MTLRKKILLSFLCVLAFVLVAAAALLFAVPRYNYAAAAQDYMSRNFSRVQRDGQGVRLESWNREIRYYRAGSRGMSDFRQGRSVVLVPGDYLGQFDHHGTNTYTIRKVLPDKVVVEYMFFHSFNGRDDTQTGTVDIKYR